MRLAGIVMGAFGALFLLSGINLALTQYDLNSPRDVQMAMGGFVFVFLVSALALYLFRRGSSRPSYTSTGNRSLIERLLISVVGLSLLLPIGIAVIGVLRPYARSSDHWATLTTDPPEFTIDMPGKPTKEVRFEDVPGGRATDAIYRSRDDVAGYVAEFLTRPQGPFSPEDVSGIANYLDSFLDQMKTRANGRVLFRNTISVARYVGREQVMDTEAPTSSSAKIRLVCATRIYLVGDSICIFTCVMENRAYNENLSRVGMRMARFFDSFKPK